MSVPSNTFVSTSAKGIREDLTDAIYNIDPTETPVLNALPRVKATQALHEWQTDSLAAANAANAHIEGDDASADAATATVRLNNRTQIFRQVAQVSGSLRSYNTAGRKDELGYQLGKRAAEQKRDIEAALCANQAKVTGSGSTAARLAGLPAWIKDNTNFLTSGTPAGADPTGDGSDARTDNSTTQAYSETIHKDVLQQCWQNGANVKLVVVSASNKQIASTFNGAATRFVKPDGGTLYAAYDVYMSDFGKITFVPSRFSRSRDALYIDPKMAAVAYARPFERVPLAKTGDSDRVMLLSELTLEVRNPKAHGIAADLT